MDFFLIRNATRAPTDLQGYLHERFLPKGATTGMAYKWVCRADTIPERGEPLSFPDELWLISRRRSLDFDCHLAFAGLLVSERFLGLLEPDDRANLKVALVNAVNAKQAAIAESPLYYAKFKSILHAVDRRKTRYIQQKFGPRLTVDRDGSAAIGLVRALTFDEAKVGGMNLFVSHDLSPNDTFVSGRLRDRIVDSGIRGIDLLPIADYFEAETFKVAQLEREYGQPLSEIADA